MFREWASFKVNGVVNIQRPLVVKEVIIGLRCRNAMEEKWAGVGGVDGIKRQTCPLQGAVLAICMSTRVGQATLNKGMFATMILIGQYDRQHQKTDSCS